MSHTPGPWTWDDSPHHAQDGAIYAGDEYLFAVPCCEDDARLVAAAPDMLDALLRLRDEGLLLPQFAIDAIAKATGIGVWA